MRIGVDVGGTDTDAVVIDGRHVLAAVKRPTTQDVRDGIVKAVQAAITRAGVDPAGVEAVMIGTTHFTNAFVQRRDLSKVFALRIGYPASRGIPPFCGWPDDVRETVRAGHRLVKGGYEFDGRPIAPFDANAIADTAREVLAAGTEQVAISCIFSQLNSDQEQQAATIFGQVAPAVGLSLSSELGRVGLLERENAAIMNASLRQLADKMADAFGDALARLGLQCPWYVSQNDGTLMSAKQLRRYPVLTFAAGPTNSLRGAAWLTGTDEAVVIDVGGTTTDLGVLTKGFPRQSSMHVDVGGVRTNFPMPDVLSIGLGGGSRVRVTDDAIAVGPDSVGYELHKKAKVFGGDELTASDIAVASGWVQFGDKAHVSRLDVDLLQKAARAMGALVADAVDRMKTSSDPVPVILVGGGGFLVREIPAGVSQVTCPEHAEVANAIGAAIGQISGNVDRIYSITSENERANAFEEVMEIAKQRVIDAGGTGETLEIVNLEAIPLQYLPGGATRVICRAVGNLAGLENQP